MEENIEMNGIKYEIKSLIEFSSLAKLLFELSKRQKNLEQQIILLQTSNKDRDNRLSNLENKFLGNMQKENDLINILHSSDMIENEINENFKNKEKTVDGVNKNNIFEKENEDNNIINDNNLQIKNKEENKNDNEAINYNINNDKDKSKKEKELKQIDKKLDDNNDETELIKEKNENIIDNKEINQNIKLDPELISQLFQKVIDLEKKIDTITVKTNNDISPKIKSNQDNIRNMNNRIGQVVQNVEEITKKILQFQEDLGKVKVKVEDFNIYDIFQGESNKDGNMDVNNALIQTLEKKVFKQFELYDEKNKKNEEDLFKNNENMNNLKGLIDNMENIIQKNSNKIKENEKIFNDYKIKINDLIDELKKQIELLESESSKEEIKNNLDEKIKIIEEKLKKLSEKLGDSINLPSGKEIDQKLIQKIDEFDKIIKEIKKSNSLFEKNMEKKIYESNKMINDEISSINEEIKSKTDSKELIPINSKLYNLEEITKSFNSRFDSLQKSNEKFKSDLNKIFQKLEYFNGEINQLKNIQNDNNNNKKYNSSIEGNNFFSFPIFTQYKKDINTKIEKMKTDLEHLFNNFEIISSSLSSYPNNKDFSKFQNNMINLLEEFKSNIHKKYMERTEIQKALKLIDNQIKTLNESSKKHEGSDSWLLAKKPISNYQCASCESILKDLEQKDNFVPWNKYPNREEKTYRIGNGYSRILEMVNEEVIKSFENRDNKGYASDDDKKSGNSKKNSKKKDKNKLNESIGLIEKKSVKLPRVNKILNLTTEKIGNIPHNKYNTANSLYKATDPFNQDEPKVTKIYKINNKKNFGLFKNKDLINTGINFNTEKISRSINKEKNKDINIQMNLTMPDNN